METKFQTSFIPKKPLTQPGSSSSSASPSIEHQTTSVVLMVGVFVFILSALAAGGAYGWQVFLNSQQNEYKKNLDDLKSNVNLQLIVELKKEATKIDLASDLLNNHVAFSQIFGVISTFTASNIRFTGLDLQAPADRSKGVKLTLNGYSPDYDSLAFQSDELGHLEALGIKNIILNPIIQNPVQNANSTISFDLSADIEPTSMLYKNAFQLPVNTATQATTSLPVNNQ